MKIIGIDCATEDKNIGVACAQLSESGLEILDIFVGGRPGSVLQHLVGSCASGEPTLLALDAPLGWPVQLGPTLAEHMAGGHIAKEPNELFRRRTDAYVKENLDRQSLDVGADRIARTAHSALRMLNGLSQHFTKQVPLAWKSPVDGLAAIEVYPAATLAAYGIPGRAYKEPEAELARRAIVDRLEQLLTIRYSKDLVLQDADALDAVICALAGADFVRGFAQGPDNRALAEKEGWIWTRLRMPT
jgi:predicted RNase H-like nuclease